MLANEATTMLHGQKEATNAEKLAKSTFRENSSGENLPSIKIDKNIINKNIIEVISYVNKDISKSEIRRLIKSKGIKIENKTIVDEKFILDEKLFKEKGFVKLSLGKKKHFKIVN